MDIRITPTCALPSISQVQILRDSRAGPFGFVREPERQSRALGKDRDECAHGPTSKRPGSPTGFGLGLFVLFSKEP